MREVEPIAETNATRHHPRMQCGAAQLRIALAFALVPACSRGGGAEAPTAPAPAPASDTGLVLTTEMSPGSVEQPAAAPGPHPLADDREADPSLALPELTASHLGMHIGGQSNSAEAKQPWLSDLEKAQPALFDCYRLVESPEKGGSYGVDLYIASTGGSPEVRSSRQKLGGEEFDTCMRKAFGDLSFHKPAQATVFSYSVVFKLVE